MARSDEEILADLDVMEHSLSCKSGNRYSNKYHQTRYDEAESRIATDLGKELDMLKLVVSLQPYEFISHIRESIRAAKQRAELHAMTERV